MKALVTGASGFVGRHLVAHLQSEHDDVAGVDHNAPEPVDITDAAAVRARIARERPEVVYHLAALSHVGESWSQTDAVEMVNVEGTRNVVDACAEAGVSTLLFVGSAEEYGHVSPDDLPITEDAPLRPSSPYASSKVAAEKLALAAAADRDLDVVAVRAFNHTGPGQSPRFLVPGLAARIAHAERDHLDEIAVGNLDPVRDISDVHDVVRAYRLLAREGAPGEVYNVCSGRGVSVRAIAYGLLSMTSRPLHLVVDPELVRPVDVPRLVGDAAKLRHATGWVPEYDITRTLWEVLAYARETGQDRDA
jgi:GDP-4-dehydro-6-deoxy-D-mannose reductase